jgi:hypothetical protein
VVPRVREDEARTVQAGERAHRTTSRPASAVTGVFSFSFLEREKRPDRREGRS